MHTCIVQRCEQWKRTPQDSYCRPTRGGIAEAYTDIINL